MNRHQCLQHADAIVHGARNEAYGVPERSFHMIARFWSAYLDRPLLESDVALMLALLKIARLRSCNNHTDSWVDLAGYAACGCECGTSTPEDETPP
jgi:hypothetical protein